MFFWDYHGVYVALTDGEEDALLREVAESLAESAKYYVIREARDRLVKRMCRHLKRQLKSDPDTFHRKYCYRCETGEDATTHFRAFLTCYAFATKRAAFFESQQSSDVEELLRYPDAGPMYSVTLFNRPWWRPWRPHPVAAVTFPCNSVQKLVGTPTNFVLATTVVDLHFAPRFVKITSFGSVKTPGYQISQSPGISTMLRNKKGLL